jgi:hypothetical protein
MKQMPGKDDKWEPHGMVEHVNSSPAFSDKIGEELK